VPITPHHVVAQLPHPGSDDPLIDALCCASQAERVAENVPAAEFLPFRAGKGSLKMVMDLVAGPEVRIAIARHIQ